MAARHADPGTLFIFPYKMPKILISLQPRAGDTLHNAAGYSTLYSGGAKGCLF